MPVSGLVVRLHPDRERARSALDAIGADDRFTVGPSPGQELLPVVLDTRGDREHRGALRWLVELPGVATVEVAHVDLGDLSFRPRRPETEKESGHDG
ncbi:MAG: hypothetical protein ACYTG1_05445 [Planctomycetota bacterium]|jgi:hypothetical protein